ncbi:MAG TPA: hypothetical protein VFK59_06800 [Actinomycetota bacterium]|jgi:hypothetical protein|nr:hypothetical protein [Actinomycetota bacterium]
MSLLDWLPDSFRPGHPAAKVRWITVAVGLLVAVRIALVFAR